MKKRLLILIAGAAIGAVSAWYFSKKKYEKESQEEIDSVKRAYERRERRNEQKSEPTANDVEDVLEERKYVPDDAPYVIPPTEFGMLDGYETIDLTLYSDGVLVDDNNDVMEEEEIEEVIGRKSLNHFGEYEDDSVYVRNDKLACDYAIILDQRKYSESAPPYKERK